MKKMTKWLLFMFPVLLLAAVVSSCEKGKEEDEENQEEDKEYVGKWESSAYPTLSLTGLPIYEKMVFNFTNTTFQDHIYQGATADGLVLASGIKGDVENPAIGEMGVEINEISLQGGPYVDKADDPDAFNTTFNATLGNILHEQFDADYIVRNDSMYLILPVKLPVERIDTLRLKKVAE